MELIAVIVFTGLVLFGLWISVSIKGRGLMSISLLSPLVVYLGSVLVRASGGIWLQVMQPVERVLKGEYGQYVIARRYIDEVSWLWVLFIFGILTVLWIGKRWIRRKARAYNSGLCSGEFLLGDKVFLVKGRNGRGLVADIVTIALAFFITEGIVGIVTGSTDRGEGYSYWAQQAFKPVSLFVSLARIKQLAYFLVPICCRDAKTKVKRCLLGVLTALSIAPGLVNGSRGELLYPLVMLTLGTVVALRLKKKAIVAAFVVISLLLPMVPYMAAYRESPTLLKTTSKDIVGRISLFLNGVPKERYSYRVSALGREIYACSDAFIFRPESIDTRVGFGDVNLEVIGDTLRPRWISSKKDFEKLDGSRIAQELIGTQVRGWFPCMSTPADLWRRGGPLAVYVGGSIVGVLLIVCELLWLKQVRSKNSIFSVFCICFPVTYYQFPLSGTVREVIWMIGWEAIKYIATLLVITKTMEALAGLTGAYSAGTRR